MKAQIKTLTLIFASLLIAATAQANVFGSDKRVQMNQMGPFPDEAMKVIRAVGKIETDKIEGSAWILPGGCHIATNFHVAFFKSRSGNKVVTMRPKKGHTVTFKIGADPVKPGVFADTLQASVVDWMGYADDYQGQAQDTVVLRLEKCVGDKYGWIEYERPDHGAMPAGDLMLVAFAPSRKHLPGVTVEIGCKAQDDGPVFGLFGTDCAQENGTSGGVIVRKRGNQYLAVGMVQSSLNSTDRILPAYHVDHRNVAIFAGAFAEFFDTTLGTSQAQRGPAQQMTQAPAQGQAVVR